VREPVSHDQFVIALRARSIAERIIEAYLAQQAEDALKRRPGVAVFPRKSPKDDP